MAANCVRKMNVVRLRASSPASAFLLSNLSSLPAHWTGLCWLIYTAEAAGYMARAFLNAEAHSCRRTVVTIHSVHFLSHEFFCMPVPAPWHGSNLPKHALCSRTIKQKASHQKKKKAPPKKKKKKKKKK